MDIKDNFTWLLLFHATISLHMCARDQVSYINVTSQQHAANYNCHDNLVLYTYNYSH